MRFCMFHEVFDIWADIINTTMHGRYGITLSSWANTYSPFSTEMFICITRSSSGMMPLKV